VPISEIGSFSYAIGWFAACLAYCRGAAGALSRRQRALGYAGAGVSLVLIAVKVIPGIPGSFSRQEYACLLGWVFLGWILWNSRARQTGATPRP
jgi:hypothetical protein